ncbi:quinol:electron acceptor oxidoreductase subunit ActD [Bdellovibrio bacteriovorus]
MGKQGRKVVYGIFQNRASLESCVSNLRLEGFRPEDVSVLMPDKGDTATFAHEKGTKAPEGAAIGGGTGAVLGGAMGWLVGIGAVATIPALGPLVAAGPIMSALAGLGVGTAVGGLAGALAGLGIPEYEAKRYEKYVKDGGILISVHVDDNDWEDKAERILESSGAKDISNSTEVSQKEFRQSSSDQKTTRF